MAEWVARSGNVTMNQSEIEYSDHSSDDDYSPRSLIIDTAGFGGGVWMLICGCVCVHEQSKNHISLIKQA